MKTLKKLIIIIPFLLGFGACDYIEEPTEMRDLEYVFSHGQETRGWLARSYAFIPDPFVAWRSSWNQYHPYIAMADEVDMGIDNEATKAYRINLGDWNPSEGGFGEKWDPYYKQIRHLHIFLENVKVIPNQNYIDTQAKVDAMKLEARFLLAYFHVLLFEQFGPIPLIKNSVDVQSSIDQLKMERNSVDEVVDYLDQELYDIAQALPATEPDTKWAGRPVKASALAVRDRLLLYAASPLFNSPNNYQGYEEFRSLSNHDGKRLFPQAYDAKKWKRAADAAKLIIDMPDYKLHKVSSPTGDPFVDGYNSYREVFTSPGNSEILFARTACDFNEYLQGIQPRQWQAGGFMAVTQKLVDAFYMSDGKTKDDSDLYSEAGMTTNPDKITVNKVVSNIAKIDRVYNMYQNREARFYVSVFFNGRKWEASKAEVNGVVEPVQFFYDGKSGRPNSDSPKTGYTSYKYVDKDDYKYNSRQKTPVLFRLAEVYLNYAEALNKYNPGDSDILFYLNEVRERAGLPKYEDVYPGKTSQADIHDAIMRERQIELNWEGTRYFDTRRYFMAEKEDAGNFYGMNTMKTQAQESQFYQRSVFEKRVFKKSFYLFPIPQWELNKNNKLVQNPYWN